MTFIIGKKLEMTQHFNEDGKVIPVTLVYVEPNIVTHVQKNEVRDSVSVQLGTQKKNRLKKAQQGHLKDLPLLSLLREFQVDETELERGQVVDVKAFEPGTKVDVVGTSKGRGFAGVMKRHGFSGQPATHGQKDQMRMPGSIGSQMQGPVQKGKKMAGHMGAKQVTVKNLEIASVDAEKNLLAIKGAVPGARGGILLITSREGKHVWQK